MEKIRVLHICDKFGVKGSSVHGISRLFSWWYPRFDPERYEVQILGLRDEDEAFQHLRDLGLPVTTLGKSKYDFSTVNAILDKIKTDKHQILHLHGYGSTSFGRIAAILGGVKHIVHEHFVDPAMPFVQRPFDRLLSFQTQYAIAVSESVKEFMIHDRYIPESKIDVIYNGAPLDLFQPSEAEQILEEKAHLGLDPEEYVIGTIGRLDLQKGITYFIDAAARLLGEGIKARFVVVGDGPLLEELQAQTRSLGIEDAFLFPGFYADVRPIQAIFDIQVFPSLWEGTPLTLFEAMAMKKAIVSTNVDGLGEVLNHGQNALVVSPRDAEGLAGAIKELVTDPCQAEQLAVQAYADSNRYDIQKTILAIQNLYERILAEGSGAVIRNGNNKRFIS